MAKTTRQGGAVVTLALALACGFLLLAGTRQPARGGAQEEARPGAAPRYTVNETQGYNLLVTDNASNTLYFYATDKDAPVGSPLKLRASLDLTKVGRDVINIKKINLENIRTREQQ
jgi:hypothetical protein